MSASCAMRYTATSAASSSRGTGVGKRVRMVVAALDSPSASERRLPSSPRSCSSIGRSSPASSRRCSTTSPRYRPTRASSPTLAAPARPYGAGAPTRPGCRCRSAPGRRRRAGRSRARFRSSSRTATCRCARQPELLLALAQLLERRPERVGRPRALGDVEPDRLQLDRRPALVEDRAAFPLEPADLAADLDPTVERRHDTGGASSRATAARAASRSPGYTQSRTSRPDHRLARRCRAGVSRSRSRR